MDQSSSGGQKGRPNRNRRRRRSRNKGQKKRPDGRRKQPSSRQNQKKQPRSGNRSNQSNRRRRRGGNRRNRGGQGKSGNRKQPPKKPSLGRRILSVVTFGLLPATPNSGGKAKAKAPKKGAPNRPATAAPGPASPPRQRPDLDGVTSSRLYVGNLAYQATESDLDELFRGVGRVLNTEVMTNPKTQQSKGFAFVEMSHVDEARRAVEILHDQDFMGRRLRISGADDDGPPNDSESSAETGSAAA